LSIIHCRLASANGLNSNGFELEDLQKPSAMNRMYSNISTKA